VVLRGVGGLGSCDLGDMWFFIDYVEMLARPE